MRREGPSLTVKIVTDSTASIPQELCRLLGITVVPVTIHFGTETHVDGIDSTEAFYSRLAQASQPPTTSTPSAGVFLETYRQVAEGASAIISIHVMETKSALVNTAKMAAGMLADLPIQVVDSRSTTLGLGLLVIAAARMAQAGRAAGEIVERLTELVAHVDTFAAIRELTQLRRSGRVSLGQAMLANLLSVKPVLYIGQGVIEVVDKARGWPTAVERMVELAQAKVGEARIAMAVVHTNAEAEARELLERVRTRFNVAEIFVAEAGTALAAHAGPGALGLAAMRVD